jgi:hypothetical protein
MELKQKNAELAARGEEQRRLRKIDRYQSYLKHYQTKLKHLQNSAA